MFKKCVEKSWKLIFIFILFMIGHLHEYVSIKCLRSIKKEGKNNLDEFKKGIQYEYGVHLTSLCTGDLN